MPWASRSKHGYRGTRAVVIKNIPCHCTEANLEEILDKRGFHGTFDLIHMPCGRRNESNQGFAFVLFKTSEAAYQCLHALDGASLGDSGMTRCRVVFACLQESSNEMQRQHRFACKHPVHGQDDSPGAALASLERTTSGLSTKPRDRTCVPHVPALSVALRHWGTPQEVAAAATEQQGWQQEQQRRQLQHQQEQHGLQHHWELHRQQGFCAVTAGSRLPLSKQMIIGRDCYQSPPGIVGQIGSAGGETHPHHPHRALAGAWWVELQDESYALCGTAHLGVFWQPMA